MLHRTSATRGDYAEPAESIEWYYLNADAEQFGPFTPRELGEHYKAGTVTDTTFVWHENIEDEAWARVYNVDELVEMHGQFPPPPEGKEEGEDGNGGKEGSDPSRRAAAAAALPGQSATKALHLAVSMADIDAIRSALGDPTCPKTAVYGDSPGRCILHNLGADTKLADAPPSEAALDEAILLLTARGASLETQGEPDWTTPLGQAVVRGDLATARALAKAGASLDATVSKRGRTLEQAAEFYLADEASRGGPISRREAMLRMIAELRAGGDGSKAMAAYFVDSLATAGIHRSHAAARLAQWLVASEVDVHASLLTEVRQFPPPPEGGVERFLSCRADAALPHTHATLQLLERAEQKLCARTTTPLADLIAARKASLLQAQQRVLDSLGASPTAASSFNLEVSLALGESVMTAGGVLFLEQVAECSDPTRLAHLFRAVEAWFSSPNSETPPPPPPTHTPGIHLSAARNRPGIPIGFSRTDLMALCRRKKKDEPSMWTPDTAMCYGALLKQLLKVRVCVIVCVCAFGVGG